MSTSNWERASALANLTVAVVTGIAVWAGVVALKEYKKANRAEARAQLYGAEREIGQLEMADAQLRRIYAEAPEGTPPEEVVRQLMAIALHGNPQAKVRPQLATVNSVQLHTFIWGTASYAAPEAEGLRKLYLHCEKYIYHVHNAFDLTDEEFIEKGEWESWRSLLEEIGPHPVCLAAVYSAEKNRYFSRDFAAEFQRSMRRNSMHKAVVDLLYPQLLTEAWPEKFPEY